MICMFGVVWVYVLDKWTADGIKIPKWAQRSNQFIYMGLSTKHASSVPLLLNPSSGVISPQFHVVLDDWFATISATEEEFPDFNSETWQKMSGDSRYQYMHADSDNEGEDVDENVPESAMDEVMTRQSRVESAMEREIPYHQPHYQLLILQQLHPLKSHHSLLCVHLYHQAGLFPQFQVHWNVIPTMRTKIMMDRHRSTNHLFRNSLNRESIQMKMFLFCLQSHRIV
jgi:hypothetical protein